MHVLLKGVIPVESTVAVVAMRIMCRGVAPMLLESMIGVKGAIASFTLEIVSRRVAKGAVGELEDSRRPYDRSDSQQPFCSTLATLDIPMLSFGEKFAAQMNLFQVSTRRRVVLMWYLQREWALFSLPIEPIDMHGKRQLPHM